VRLEAALAVTRGAFDFEVEFATDSTLAIVGANGAGKSTLLAALAGLVDSTGPIRLGDRQLDGLPPEARRIGYVFQDYLLFPHLTVLENVAFGPRALGRGRVAAGETATSWLDRLGIPELAGRRPAQLSGGQAQRVALARALATDPDFLLLDEPLAALDVEVRDDVRAELATHLADWGGLTIVVTHDRADAAALADDILVLERGRAVQRGSFAQLADDPATPWVARFTR
jgi:molybdate transport system ATP-binding protein